MFSSSGAAASRKEWKREVPAGGTPEYKPLSTRALRTREGSSAWLSHYSSSTLQEVWFRMIVSTFPLPNSRERAASPGFYLGAGWDAPARWDAPCAVLSRRKEGAAAHPKHWAHYSLPDQRENSHRTGRVPFPAIRRADPLCFYLAVPHTHQTATALTRMARKGHYRRLSKAPGWRFPPCSEPSALPQHLHFSHSKASHTSTSSNQTLAVSKASI